MEFIAHRKTSENDIMIDQSVAEHCRNTAQIAANCLQYVGLSQAAYLSGLLHDAGKCKKNFQEYLLNGQGRRGSVNHTFAGCRMLFEHFHGEISETYEDVTCEILAYAIGAHHGLFDCIDETGNSGFMHRIKKSDIDYEESKNNFLISCANWEEIEERFKQANQELSKIYNQIEKLSDENDDETGEEFSFYIGLLTRLIASAVIEGDRSDTASFMNGTSDLPKIKNDKNFWEKYLINVENKLHSFPQDNCLQKARGKISDTCRNFAENPVGVYRLNVPTGGGKTLSSLRYALAHATKWGKKRIIFVTPLLAILEQNAKAIREFIGDDSIILEHHSNVITTEESGDYLDLHELAVESWHVPVIITTMVQLLNTMFLGKTTSVRRFEALCNAVIVMDEVQTVPNHMLTLFNLAVNFLSKICGTTFLLCSATQPCFEQVAHPLMENANSTVVPFQDDLWKPFHRTVITDSGGMRLDEIPLFAKDILTKSASLLIICNKKSEAEFLYQTMSGDIPNCFHLSASMCMAHRRDTLEQITQSLQKKHEKTLCISTQVMEAGIDISFQRVIRLAAGMDSIVQSAGRCNRNGENSEPVPVYVVQCMNEHLGKLREIQYGKDVTIALFNEFHNNPQQFQNDLSSDTAIKWYYRKLYQQEMIYQGFQDYMIDKRKVSIFSMLSGNTQYFDMDGPLQDKFSINQAFKLAGSLFCVFDENTEDVVVPYGKGVDLLKELEAFPSCCAPALLKDWSKRAKPYTISLYEYQKNLIADGLRCIHGILVLQPEFYDRQTGLSLKTENTFLEV